MRLSEKTVAAVDHGGSLGRARALFPHAPEPFVDLSTGINPHSYPLFSLAATVLTRLPEPARLNLLLGIAAKTYGAPSADTVIAAPGTQVLLPLVAALVAPGRAAVLGATYAEHARTAALAGHTVAEVTDFDALADADLAIVVNPNNPDGRVLSRSRLLDFARQLRGRGGLLVVDEAFMDAGPHAQSLAGDVAAGGIVVLRSFGKFFGLAGVRLGFALAAPAIAGRLSGQLGPWAVSGTALEYGIRALADTSWQDAMRARLAADAARLDGLLVAAGVSVTGGTALYRYLDFPGARALFETLGGQGIVLRHFADRPNALRIGLPGGEAEWRRLGEALAVWTGGAHHPHARGNL